MKHKDMTSLNILEELTKEIKTPPTLKDHEVNRRGCIIEYEGDKGTVLGFGLLNKATVAVQDVFSSKGSLFCQHSHVVREWFILYKGKYKVIIFDDSGDTVIFEKVLAPGDSIYIDPHRLHSCEALEDSWMLAVTVPADEDYPKIGG